MKFPNNPFIQSLLGKPDYSHPTHTVPHHPMGPIGEPNVRQHLTEVNIFFCINGAKLRAKTISIIKNTTDLHDR